MDDDSPTPKFLDIALQPLKVGDFVISTKSCKNVPNLRFGVVLAVNHEMHKARIRSVARATRVNPAGSSEYVWYLLKSGIIFHDQRIMIIDPARIPPEPLKLLKDALMDYDPTS